MAVVVGVRARRFDKQLSVLPSKDTNKGGVKTGGKSVPTLVVKIKVHCQGGSLDKDDCSYRNITTTSLLLARPGVKMRHPTEQ